MVLVIHAAWCPPFSLKWYVLSIGNITCLCWNNGVSVCEVCVRVDTFKNQILCKTFLFLIFTMLVVGPFGTVLTVIYCDFVWSFFPPCWLNDAALACDGALSVLDCAMQVLFCVGWQDELTKGKDEALLDGVEELVDAVWVACVWLSHHQITMQQLPSRSVFVAARTARLTIMPFCGLVGKKKRMALCISHSTVCGDVACAKEKSVVDMCPFSMHFKHLLLISLDSAPGVVVV